MLYFRLGFFCFCLWSAAIQHCTWHYSHVQCWMAVLAYVFWWHSITSAFMLIFHLKLGSISLL